MLHKETLFSVLAMLNALHLALTLISVGPFWVIYLILTQTPPRLTGREHPSPGSKLRDHFYGSVCSLCSNL